MTALPEYPRLRRGLAASPDEDDPDAYYLWDPLRVSRRPVRLSRQELTWAQLWNGQRSLRDAQFAAMQALGGLLVPLERLTHLVARLDEALLLESPRFVAHVSTPIREPACVGCYDADPERLRRQLDAIFTGLGGPGLPGEPRPSARPLRIALLPHIDYARGGTTYAWGFKELFERCDASLFVIVGTAHYSANRFTLTRQHFRTPLGVVETDRSAVELLAGHYGDGLFDDPVAHLPEHSIELEVVFLQHLYAKRRPIRIVPLLVGSFHDSILGELSPGEMHDIKRMIEALRRFDAETAEPVCYLISGDLAHLGPKFGDPTPVREPTLDHSRERDWAVLRAAEAADPAGYFALIAEEGDIRRVCGFPPTVTVLEALRPSRGRVLHYDQYAHPHGHESVSFASMAFER